MISVINILRTVVIGMLMLAAALPAQAQSSLESKIKSVFLYNFTHFIQWPQSAFANDNRHFVIGTLGGNPFDQYLETVVKGERVNGLPIVIRHYKNVQEAQHAHILYINRSMENELNEIIPVLKNKGVLTVSDIRNFTTSGGIIRFYSEGNKIKLEINPSAAKTAHLTVSSKLLRVSTIKGKSK